MRKGHYGHYTGNARHSRKEEMIHDREMIYDAKTQIHNEDKKYRETGKDAYKQDMIHERELIHDTKGQLHHADSDYKGSSPAHISYSSKFGGLNLPEPKSNGAYTNFDGGAAGEISAMKQKAAGFNRALDQVTNATVDYINKTKGKSDVKDTGGGDVDKKSLEKYLPKTPEIRSTNFGEQPDLVALGKKGQDSIQTSVGKTNILEHIQTNKGFGGDMMSTKDWNALSPEKRRSMNAAVGADKFGNIQKNTYTMNGKSMSEKDYNKNRFGF